ETKAKLSSPLTQAIVLFVLFLTGASVPIAERMIPRRDYDRFTMQAKSDLTDRNIFSSDEIREFLTQEDAVLLSGTGLYPRFIRSNSRVYLAGAPSGYTYLHFWLINEADNQIILALQNAPTNIPHTATVSVLGCQDENYIVAFAMIVHEPSEQIILRDPE